MKNSIELVVACGGGIFTTTVVTEKIQEILKKERISFKITPQKITEIPGITGVDLIIVTGKTKQKNAAGIPIMIGLPLFTGVGADKFTEEMLTKIREIMND